MWLVVISLFLRLRLLSSIRSHAAALGVKARESLALAPPTWAPSPNELAWDCPNKVKIVIFTGGKEVFKFWSPHQDQKEKEDDGRRNTRKRELELVSDEPEETEEDLYCRLCRSTFAASLPGKAQNNTSKDIIGVCMIAMLDSKTGKIHHPLGYFEYSRARGGSNFVATKVQTDYVNGRGRQEDVWKLVCRKPSPYEDCQDVVDVGFNGFTALNGFEIMRGHLLAANQQSQSTKASHATFNFLNTFPSWKEFDKGPWNDREKLVVDYVRLEGEPLGSGRDVWSVVGVGDMSAHTVRAERFQYLAAKDIQRGDRPKHPPDELSANTPRSVFLPKWVWTAVFDPIVGKATGWICYNVPHTEAHCMDRLSIKELEGAVKFSIFPGLPEEILLDGRWSGFWKRLPCYREAGDDDAVVSDDQWSAFWQHGDKIWEGLHAGTGAIAHDDAGDTHVGGAEHDGEGRPSGSRNSTSGSASSSGRLPRPPPRGKGPGKPREQEAAAAAEDNGDGRNSRKKKGGRAGKQEAAVPEEDDGDSRNPRKKKDTRAGNKEEVKMGRSAGNQHAAAVVEEGDVEEGDGDGPRSGKKGGRSRRGGA